MDAGSDSCDVNPKFSGDHDHRLLLRDVLANEAIPVDRDPRSGPIRFQTIFGGRSWRGSADELRPWTRCRSDSCILADTGRSSVAVVARQRHVCMRSGAGSGDDFGSALAGPPGCGVFLKQRAADVQG